ncbi:hypothetical protein HDE_14591 [Halotydeus destructor]|nr:hypothetical protein HDE_14591 [Halotydeus destructor]
MINDVKTQNGDLDDRMSIIAFTYFAQTFAALLTYSVDYLKFGLNGTIGFQAVMLAGLLSCLIFILVLAFFCDIYNQRFRAEYRKQYGAVLLREGLSPRAAYISSREHSFKLRVTAYGMFDLNKKCVLSYASALVTFTILFMQLNRVL